MANLVVILAPAGPAVAIRETLRDLSAVGLIEPFVWLDATSVGQGTINALAVKQGKVTGTSLQALATAERPTRIRLVSLVPVFGGLGAVDSAVEQQVALLLQGSTGNVPFTPIRAVITRIGDPTTSGAIARMGWHNVLLAPEKSMGPSLGRARLESNDDAHEVGKYATAALAGVAGLWRDLDDSPFDDMNIEPGESIRVARSYFRKLQSASLESQLRALVTATAEALPLPTEGGSSAVYVEDSSLATKTMAKALWERHKAILSGPREKRQASSAKPIGALGAIKMFFGFLWASLRNAPQQWMRSVVVSVSSHVARTVHNAVFGGNPSAYEVIVGGVTSTGLPASWLDLADAVDSIDDILEQSGEQREHHSLDDHATLWKEFAAGAMTLADGGDRVKGLAPVQIGPRRGVLRNVGLCVPSPASRFTAIPGHLAAKIGVVGVDAYDVLAINNLHARLMHMQSEASVGLEVGSTLRALEAWNTEHRGSYAGRAGSTLGEALVKTSAEIKSFLEELRSAGAAEDIPAAMAARQKKLSKLLRIVALVFGVVVLGVLALFGFAVISATIALIAGISAVVMWLVTTVVAFARGQRDLFRMMNARQELIANVEVIKRNLRYAVRDLKRLTDAYAQFLAWSRLLGSFLAAPFGSPVTVDDDGERLGSGLPMSVKLGAAVVEPEALGNAVVTLRRDIFRAGWLTEPWEEIVAAAPSMIGPDAYELRSDPWSIYGHSGAGSGSLLVRWADLLVAQGVDPSVADRLWHRVLEQLDGDKRELAQSLLESITEVGQSSAQRVSYNSFMDGVDDPAAVTSSSNFDPEVFEQSVRATASSHVDRSWGRTATVGLSRVAVMTQLSAGSQSYFFVAHGQSVGREVASAFVVDDSGLQF